MNNDEHPPLPDVVICNRTACKAELGREGRPTHFAWWNRSTYAWYCQRCAFKINDASRDIQPPLLFRVILQEDGTSLKDPKTP